MPGGPFQGTGAEESAPTLERLALVLSQALPLALPLLPGWRKMRTERSSEPQLNFASWNKVPCMRLPGPSAADQMVPMHT